MSSRNGEVAPHKNPNLVPLGLNSRARERTALPSRLAVSANQYAPTTMPLSQSPPRPTQGFEIYEDEGWSAENWAADKEELYDQIEKLTLRLDTANVQISSQKCRVADLEQQLKANQKLIEEYQKRLRKELAAMKEEVKKREDIMAQCERFKREVVRLSHQLHYTQTANSSATGESKVEVDNARKRRKSGTAKDKRASKLAKTKLGDEGSG